MTGMLHETTWAKFVFLRCKLWKLIQKLAPQKLRKKSSAHTCGAKNRRCGSSHATSPIERAEFYWAGQNGGYNKHALAFYLLS